MSYRIIGLPEGYPLQFKSKVIDLEQHPELWEAESPYSVNWQYAIIEREENSNA